MRINALTGQRREFWQSESWDHFLRRPPCLKKFRERGVLHRDLKPGNIQIVSNSNANSNASTLRDNFFPAESPNPSGAHPWGRKTVRIHTSQSFTAAARAATLSSARGMNSWPTKPV